MTYLQSDAAQSPSLGNKDVGCSTSPVEGKSFLSLSFPCHHPTHSSGLTFLPPSPFGLIQLFLSLNTAF